MWEKMSDEKMEKMTKKLKEMGVDEKLIDEKLAWIVSKVSFKLSWLRLILDDKGIKEDEAKKMIEKLVKLTLEKDLEKVKEWHKEHEERHH